MKNPNDLTIIIIPTKNKKSINIKVPLKKLLISISIFLIFIIFLITFSIIVMRTNRAPLSYQNLRKQSEAQQQQLKNINIQVNKLERKIQLLIEKEEKIRMLIQ